MAVVNVTQDSFYTESRTPTHDAAVAAGLRHLEDGAAIVDVGGESSRPGASPVPVDEELRRVVPVVRRLAAVPEAIVSVDTYKAEVARAAVEAGATLVNDVSGGSLDPAMPDVAAELGVPIIVGHLRGTPETMQHAARYSDVIREVRDELRERIDRLVAAGVEPGNLLIDPGIGFAKGTEESLTLIARLGELATLGRPIVIGVSRKRFLAALLDRSGAARGDGPEGRLAASLAAAVLAAAHGAVLVRAHDVLATRQSLAIADAILQGV
jgi:dihydropteroate synthase